MSYRLILPALALVLLAGCASSAPDSKVSSDDAARFNVQLGMNYMRRGNLQEAREKLERAVEQDSSLPSAHAALGILYERVGDTTRAGDHLLRATRLAPDDPNMLNSYGGFLCRQGEREEGIRRFQMAANNAYYQTPEVALTNAAVCARSIPDLDQAEAYLRRALEVNRTYGEALLQMADLSLEMDEALQARAFAQRYEAVAPATPASLELGRNIELAAGDRRAAQAYALRLQREFPDSNEARRLARD